MLSLNFLSAPQHLSYSYYIKIIAAGDTAISNF